MFLEIANDHAYKLPTIGFVQLWTILPLPANLNSGDSPMTEERKHALLFTAALLCARKLIELDSDRPSPAKLCAVENAISQAAFILERIDKRWPEKN